MTKEKDFVVEGVLVVTYKFVITPKHVGCLAEAAEGAEGMVLSLGFAIIEPGLRLKGPRRIGIVVKGLLVFWRENRKLSEA